MASPDPIGKLGSHRVKKMGLKTNHCNESHDLYGLCKAS